MSKYTTEVRFICENMAQLGESKGGNDVEDILTASWDKIFTNFPIFNEGYRATLCKKILRHFYTREIGFETYGLWKLKLNTKMNEIMPYYNQLYQSELITYDPFTDVDLRREVSDSRNKIGNKNGTIGDTKNRSKNDTRTVSDGYSKSTDESNSNSNTTSNTNYNVYSDTPQGGLTGVDDGTYLTEARKVTDSGSNNGSGTSQSNEISQRNVTDGYAVMESSSGSKSTSSTDTESVSGSLIETLRGKRSGASDSVLLMELRKTFLNIDMQIINDLEVLFMGLW